MKKTRLFASLLCVMMIVCALPVMQVSADGDVASLNIEDGLALGGITATAVASSNVWNFANSTMDSYSRSGKLSMPAGAKCTAEGLDLSGTNGTDVWHYYAFEGWSPMNATNTGTVIDRALYFKVKGKVNISWTGSDTKRQSTLQSYPGETLKAVGTATIEYTNFTVDENWVEYLLIKDNTNRARLAIRQPEGKNTWGWYGKACTGYQNNLSTNGIQFSGTGVIAEFRTIEYSTDVVAATAPTPEGADYLLFDEEFENIPSYSNKTLGKAVTVADGIASTAARYANETEGIEASSGNMYFYNVFIPEGGYAEFKVRSNGADEYGFYDGEKSFYIQTMKDYGSMQGGVNGGNLFADSDMAWRTWRILRTESGYSVYSKAEGDTGWRIHAIDGYCSTENELKHQPESSQMYFYFKGNCNGTGDGNGQMAYLKVYGSTPTASLTLTDGYGSVAVESGETLSYPTSLRAIVTPETAKLFVASYKGNSMVNLKVVDSSEIIHGSVVLNPYQKGVDKVEVFLWDGFEKQTNLSGKYSLGVIQ